VCYLLAGVVSRGVGMSRWSKVLHLCVADGVAKRSLLVACVVGSILNLINQGDALLRGGRIDLVKAALTFAVPYCVATYGAVSYRLKVERNTDKRSSGPEIG
jgi:hypothetical protein